MTTHSEIQETRHLLRGPILLAHDNFTPLTRTPWGGKEIWRRYKSHLAGTGEEQAIGESWEISCDPTFPSKISETEITLQEVIDAFPEEMLSPALVKHGVKTCEILVKLLNAADPLSLQIHPEDGDGFLAPGECGKPESWLILHAEPGAGLYLGFSRAISRDGLREILSKPGDEAKEVLQFVPVKAGDYFEIAPGVPHAIGPGVTLLEPQRIRVGQSGKTYRVWDWGRVYNDKGFPDPVRGKPRELHLDAGLRLMDPMTQVGESFVASTRRLPRTHHPRPGFVWQEYPANPHFQVHVLRCEPRVEAVLEVVHGYAVATQLEGKMRMKGGDGLVEELFFGQSAFCQPLQCPFVYMPQPGGSPSS